MLAAVMVLTVPFEARRASAPLPATGAPVELALPDAWRGPQRGLIASNIRECPANDAVAARIGVPGGPAGAGVWERSSGRSIAFWDDAVDASWVAGGRQLLVVQELAAGLGRGFDVVVRQLDWPSLECRSQTSFLLPVQCVQSIFLSPCERLGALALHTPRGEWGYDLFAVGDPSIERLYRGRYLTPGYAGPPSFASDGTLVAAYAERGAWWLESAPRVRAGAIVLHDVRRNLLREVPIVVDLDRDLAPPAAAAPPTVALGDRTLTLEWWPCGTVEAALPLGSQLAVSAPSRERRAAQMR